MAYVLGNSSAAYLLIPFLAGLVTSSRFRAALLGVVATTFALTAFYWTASTLYLGTLSLDGSLGRWYAAGVGSGVLLGLVGHLARRRRVLALLCPLLLVLEPIATAAAAAVGLGSGVPAADLAIGGAVEAGIGLLLLVGLLTRRARWTRTRSG